jgi:hypothetical protein
MFCGLTSGVIDAWGKNELAENPGGVPVLETIERGLGVSFKVDARCRGIVIGGTAGPRGTMLAEEECMLDGDSTSESMLDVT